MRRNCRQPAQNHKGGRMSDNLDPLKLISILHVILRDLEEMLSQAPERTDEVIDNRAIRLRNQIDRLKSVLTKHKDAESRKRELAKQNRQNTRPRSGTKLSRGTP